RPWAPARPPPAGRRAPGTGVRGLYHRLRALDTIRRLRPLWRAIHAVVPGIPLLPQYHGFAALRSTGRHAPLAAIRLPVEILDGYVALTPWMSAEALRVARVRAQEEGLTGTGFAVAVDAAVLATALYARRQGLPPAADPVPRSALALVPA